MKVASPNVRSRHATPSLRWVFVSCVIFGAIATHLSSEVFSMGSDAAEAILSPRHAYLMLAACACALFGILQMWRLARAATGALDLRRQITLGLNELPLHGRWQFCLLTALAQFGVGTGTAIGEGCLFCGHDFVAGIAGALFTAIALALGIRALAARAPQIGAAVASLIPAAQNTSADNRINVDRVVAPMLRRSFWSIQLANRPPPVPSAL